MKVIFDPCAQNTIIRPMAQAICVARGGKAVEYVDTSNQQKKVITLDQLRFLDLKMVKVGARDVYMDGYQAALIAQHGEPVQVQVNVNDVKVVVDAKTTPDQAMAQFHQKYNQSIRVARKIPAKRRSPHQNGRV